MEHASIGATPSLGLTRRNLLRWISLSSAAGLWGCGGGGTEPPSGGGTGGGGGGGPTAGEPTSAFSSAGSGVAGAPVSVAQRQATLAALEDKLTGLYDPATGRASAAQMIAWLQEQPAFKTVGYSGTGDVYAVFTDGRPLIVATNIRFDAAGVSDGPDRAPHMASRTRSQALSTRSAALATGPGDFEAGVPSRQFRYLNTWYSYGPDWPADTWCRGDLAAMSDLGEVHAFMEEFGYQSVNRGDAPGEAGLPQVLTVEGLKSVSGDGVFLWTTHGGTLDPEGNIIQGLMTATTAFQSTVEDTYADEFAEGTLIYYTGPLCLDPIACRTFGGGGTAYTRLAITPKFIRKYQWSFGEHSLVFVNACASATGAMKQAFLDAGASVYLGWTKPARVWAMCGAAMDFFSLMLGLNENAGGRPDEVQPLQRPYDWGAVMTHLHANTQAVYYLDEEDGIVELEPTFNDKVPAGFMALRPSVYWTSFDEGSSEWHLIGGVFGTHAGTAAIGTGMPCDNLVTCTRYGYMADRRLGSPTPVGVKDWKSENVVLSVPRQGAGSAGILQVEVDGRWSNGVQLTRVSGHLRGVKTVGGSLTLQVDADISFRGDFRGVRLNPFQELTYLPIVACSVAPQARGSYVASGVYTFVQGNTTTRIEWSGQGAVGPFGPDTGAVVFTGTVVPATRRGRFLVALNVVGIREKVTVSFPGLEPQVRTRDISVQIESEISTGASGPMSIDLAFSPAYAAPAVAQTHVQAGAGPYNDADAVTTITCGPFGGEYPPELRLGGR